MKKPLIVVTAPVQTRSGYGNHSRDICRALIEDDKYDVRIQSVRWGNTPLNALEKDNYIFVYFSSKSETDLNDINEEDSPITNYQLTSNGFREGEYVFEEVLVDFKCDWSRIL